MPPNNLGTFAVLIGTLAIVFNFSLHKIDEGHVGVYYRVREFIFKLCDYIYTVCISMSCNFFIGWCLAKGNEQSGLSHDVSISNNSPFCAGILCPA